MFKSLKSLNDLNAGHQMGFANVETLAISANLASC